MTRTQPSRVFFLTYSLFTAPGWRVLAAPLKRCDGDDCASDSSHNNFVGLLVIILAVVGCFLIFAIVSVVVSKHRRPNLSDAANRRRELERQRQLDSSRALMGYAAYAQVNSGGTDPKGLPPSPLPQNTPIIPVIKVYPASIRRTSLSTIASQSDTEDLRVSYQNAAEEDQESMLSHAVPPGESVDGDHDTPPNYPEPVPLPPT